MLMCNDTSTLFYADYVRGVITWHKKVLHNTFINQDVAYIRAKTGATSNYKCKAILTDLTGYKTLTEYKQAIDKANLWTIGLSQMDFIVEGEVLEDITVVGDKAIKEKYRTYVVKSIDEKKDFTGNLHRIEVLGV